MLLARPQPHTGQETVNDRDGLLANFWRALALEPDRVRQLIHCPPADLELQVRHRWLLERRTAVEAGLADPNWCDPAAAAWWAWGQAHAYQQRWTERSSRPVLDPTPAGPNRLDGAELLAGLAQRLRRVAVLHRDWSEVVRPPLLFRNNTRAVGVFLDPPYEGDEGVYVSRVSVAGDVWDWARQHGSDPRLRVAVCGYDDGRPTPRGWRVLAWSSQGSGARRSLERVWLSPFCQPPEG